MPTYKYSAVTATGEPVAGVMDGFSIHSVAAALFDQGLDVRGVRKRANPLKFEVTKYKAKRSEVMHFSRQLAAFVRAGVPIADSIEILQEETKDKVLRKVLADMIESLRRGDSLSAAVAPHTDAFPPFYVSVLRSVELTGQLDLVLDQLSQYLERDLEARRKIKAAMAYPVVVMAMSFMTIAIMAGFVLPKFKVFFDSLNAKLPLPTRMLLTTTGFLTSWWWALLLGVVAAAVAFVFAGRTAIGRLVKHTVMLKIPAVGVVARYAVVERFCRILCSMVQAGVPLPDALHLASEGTNNVVYQSALATARESMLEGLGLARPIAETGMFPGAVTQMLRVGEDTGTLDKQLESMAAYYEKELEYKLKNLTTLFEPIAILLMGLIVGFVAVALVSAMYGIYKQVKT
jgi:type IV pilus assembly protein PilC